MTSCALLVTAATLKITTVFCKNAKTVHKMQSKSITDMTPTRRLSYTLPVYYPQVINTAIYTIGQIRQLNLKRSFVCERTRVGLSGLPDHVWFGSCGATSAQQAYDLSAIHAPFCCSHGSSQTVGCMLSAPFFLAVICP